MGIKQSFIEMAIAIVVEATLILKTTLILMTLTMTAPLRKSLPEIASVSPFNAVASAGIIGAFLNERFDFK